MKNDETTKSGTALHSAMTLVDAGAHAIDGCSLSHRECANLQFHISAQTQRIGELEGERDKVEEALGYYPSTQGDDWPDNVISELTEQREGWKSQTHATDNLRVQLKTARKALKFYGDEREHDVRCGVPPSAVAEDRGYKARAALKEMKGPAAP